MQCRQLQKKLNRKVLMSKFFHSLRARLALPDGGIIREFKVVLMVFVVLALLLYQGVYLLNRETPKNGFGGTDYAVFYVAGGVLSGADETINAFAYQPRDIYGDLGTIIREVRHHKGALRFLYPPTAAVLFMPLSLISYEISYKTWTVVNALIFVAAFYLSILFFDRDIFRIRYSVLLFALNFSDSFGKNISTGQINTLIWLFLLGVAYLLYKKRQNVAGFLLAVATAIKTFPVFFALYCIVKRKWRALISAGVVLCVLVLISLPIVGLSTYKAYVVDELVPQFQEGNASSGADNNSLLGSFQYMVHEKGPLTKWFPVTSLEKIAKGVHYALTLILGIVVFLLLQKTHKRQEKFDYLLDYSILMLFFLLFSPDIHVLYHIWTLPLIIFLLHHPLRFQYLPAVLLGLLTLFLTQYYRSLPVPAAYGFFFMRLETVGLLLLFILSLLLRLRHMRSFVAVPTEEQHTAVRVPV